MSGPTVWADVAPVFGGYVIGLVAIALLVVTLVSWAFAVGMPDDSRSDDD